MLDTKEKRENLKARVQVVFETRRRHSRSQESQVHLLLNQRNRLKTKEVQQHRPDAPKEPNSIYLE